MSQPAKSQPPLQESRSTNPENSLDLPMGSQLKRMASSFMKRILLPLLTFVAVVSTAGAQLVLSNWSITSDTLTFDISGTFTTAQAPASNPGLLWLADVGNGSWINNNMNPAVVVSGTIDGFDADSNSPTVFSFTGNGTTHVGAHLDYSGMPPFNPGIAFDFTDGSSNEVNLHVELISPGKYNPANINPVDLELYWGGNTYSGDTNSAVAMNLSSVPEPSTYAVMVGGITLVTTMVFRRRGKRP